MGSTPNPLIVDVTIDGIQMSMKIDTVLLISEKTFQRNWTEKELKVSSSVLLQTYTRKYTGSERLY